MSNENTLHIAPAGSFAPEIKALAQAAGFSSIEYHDDNPKANVKRLEEIPNNAAIALAVGAPKTRKIIKGKISKGHNFPKLIHPTVIFLDPEQIAIGRGSLITAANVISTNVEIGEFVMINLQCTIGHDCTIGDYCSLMPGARLSGGVKLEKEVFVGTNAVILPYLKVGAGATIGAGAVVTEDVPPGRTFAGVPAIDITKS
ncbi:MAG: NeuD/PglB/VioB family sugar acetyltransferase [Bacteroidetes bacterium]|nr:NeuD/PglB/VioB family sugar acetyltransferase [Bacteroidota bacterium]